MDVIGLEDKVAVVTGGGGNIGSATVRMLAEVGARVLVADVDAGQADAAAAAVRARGSDAIAMAVDVRRPDQIASMVDAALARWDRIDVGVNIVGGGDGTGKSFLELSDAEWESSVEANLYTAVRCSRAYVQAMVERGIAGSIVNIASPAGLRAAPSMVAYGASKAALINFTWTLAVEVAAYGIRANVVVPAFVPRPGMSWGGTEEQQDALARRTVPMGRVTRAEDVAGAILAFASNLTSFSTGQMIVCDGGRLLTNPINPGPAAEPSGDRASGGRSTARTGIAKRDPEQGGGKWHSRIVEADWWSLSSFRSWRSAVADRRARARPPGLARPTPAQRRPHPSPGER